jgi:hypothetical protein
MEGREPQPLPPFGYELRPTGGASPFLDHEPLPPAPKGDGGRPHPGVGFYHPGQGIPVAVVPIPPPPPDHPPY